MELGLSYTTGYADPTQVKRLTRKVRCASIFTLCSLCFDV